MGGEQLQSHLGFQTNSTLFLITNQECEVIRLMRGCCLTATFLSVFSRHTSFLLTSAVDTYVCNLFSERKWKQGEKKNKRPTKCSTDFSGIYFFIYSLLVLLLFLFLNHTDGVFKVQWHLNILLSKTWFFLARFFFCEQAAFGSLMSHRFGSLCLKSNEEIYKMCLIF